jgi:putative ABC transport system permease protein
MPSERCEKKVFTAIAVCFPAIGSSTTASMFSFADAMLLRPLPVPEPDRVLAITTAVSAQFGQNAPISCPDYIDLRERNRTFGNRTVSDQNGRRVPC